MHEESQRDSATEAMRRINEAWLNGRVEDLAPMVHPDVVMALPGFSGRVQGGVAFLEGFREFCESAKMLEFREHDRQIDVTGDVAVATFRYDLVYEQGGKRSRSTGRDLWVLRKHGGDWRAVWRTMLDTKESVA